MERLGTALESTNLAWSDHQTKDIDFITASGLTRTKLGALLARAYLANDPKSLNEAIETATDHTHRRMKGVTRGMRYKLCQAAVKEFLTPLCKPCGGTGQALHGQKWVTCPRCQGTKIHRYNNQERAALLELDTLGAWDRHYAAILNHIHSAFTEYRAQVKKRMKTTISS